MADDQIFGLSAARMTCNARTVCLIGNLVRYACVIRNDQTIFLVPVSIPEMEVLDFYGFKNHKSACKPSVVAWVEQAGSVQLSRTREHDRAGVARVVFETLTVSVPSRGYRSEVVY